MGAGASIEEAASKISAASAEDIQSALAGLSAADRARVASALGPAPAPAGGASGADAAVRMRIFHINDVYVLDNFPALKTCVNELSKGFPKANVLTTLGGDFLAPSLLSSIDHGLGIVDVMNHVPIDAICFGNHECDVSHNSLLQRIEEYKGKWLNSNMPTFTAEEPISKGKLPDNHLIELEGGRSVALIGMCCGGGKSASLYREGAFNGHAARMLPISEEIDNAVARAKAAYPSVDCIIPLTHQDMPDDLALCGRGFPCILGGHDHAVFNETKDNTLIIKAGEDAYRVAVIDLVWEPGAPQGPPTSVSVEMVPLAKPRKHKGEIELKYGPDPDLAALVAKWERPAKELEAAILARLEPNLYTSVGVRKGESTMATLICSAMMDVVSSDGAIINAGSVRGNKVYSDGKIGFADLNAECPYPSANIQVLIEGSALSNGIKHSRQPWFGGPGGRPGRENESGDALHTDDQMICSQEDGSVMQVAGKPLDPAKVYNVLIDSYLMQSNPVFKEYADKYPERIPPDDSGRPALPILVQYFCDQTWVDLVKNSGDPGWSLKEKIDHFFDEADEDKSGCICEDELLQILKKRTNDCPGVARVIASQCLSFADATNSGTVTKPELLKFFEAELAEHEHNHHELKVSGYTPRPVT